ncbi:hypothetical protein D3C72_2289670 [compost metagenome]
MQPRSSTAQLAISTSSWLSIGLSALMNCGRKAAKNRMSLGLLAPRPKACQNMLRKPGLTGGASPPTGLAAWREACQLCQAR